MENTQEQKTPETLKPEQMESGKWYVVTITDSNDWLIKFDKNDLEYCYHQIGIFMRDGSIYNHIGALCLLIEIKSIRHATKEEVLKYFPDEVFEPIELRPEEPTDWKAMYNELKAKYDQLEPKGEKVYFYFNEKVCEWEIEQDKKTAIDKSPNYYTIYEGYSIGKKKSVLVNETT